MGTPRAPSSDLRGRHLRQATGLSRAALSAAACRGQSARGSHSAWMSWDHDCGLGGRRCWVVKRQQHQTDGQTGQTP